MTTKAKSPIFTRSPILGRIRRRLALAIILTALIPLLVAVWLADSAIRHASSRFFIPEVGTRLDQSLELYQELARSIKARMRAEARGIARDPALLDALAQRDRQALERALKQSFERSEDLVLLKVQDEEGAIQANVDRGSGVDPSTEKRLEVVNELDAPGMEPGAEPFELVAVFATDRSRFDQLAGMGQFVTTYKQIESRRHADEQSYVAAFALLLGITILAAVGVGTLFAHGVTKRIDILARGIRHVGAGDLSVRVPIEGQDEITDLARAFNHMLAEVEASRSRIEYLQRIGAWQEMARRLAHEIKNPLTPIQLAVQEIHRRYQGADSEYQKLVDTTLEVVEDEVATLRRLVGEFSDFARLPQAKLEPADLAEFLREQAAQMLPMGERDDEERPSGFDILPSVELRFEVPEGSAMVRMDRLMFRRAFINLVRNAMQALDAAQTTSPLVVITLSHGTDQWHVDVDDNGPGIDHAQRAQVFDPYMTTKSAGTGLGLAIVKKIVVEHGGNVVAEEGPLGGARLRVTLPEYDVTSPSAPHPQLLDSSAVTA